MGLFRHPHLVRGVVHTPHGAFRIERGVVDLPDSLGESLGWQPLDEDKEEPRVPSAPPEFKARDTQQQQPSTTRTPTARQLTLPSVSTDGALDAILTAVDSVIRSREQVELPTYGIDVGFDLGVVAVCRRCRVSWSISGRHLKSLAWWTCPQGCGRTEGRPHAASLHGGLPSQRGDRVS